MAIFQGSKKKKQPFRYDELKANIRDILIFLLTGDTRAVENEKNKFGSNMLQFK